MEPQHLEPQNHTFAHRRPIGGKTTRKQEQEIKHCCRFASFSLMILFHLLLIRTKIKKFKKHSKHFFTSINDYLIFLFSHAYIWCLMIYLLNVNIIMNSWYYSVFFLPWIYSCVMYIYSHHCCIFSFKDLEHAKARLRTTASFTPTDHELYDRLVAYRRSLDYETPRWALMTYLHMNWQFSLEFCST